MTKLPLYFLSHGGPTFMYLNAIGGDPGAYQVTREIGRKIVQEYKPNFILCVSAHWQTRDVEVAVPKTADGANQLIYDFYGFPQNMYEETFDSHASTLLANKVVQHLQSTGLSAKTTVRGIDHGTWVPFKVAFGEALKSIPLLQISLPAVHAPTYENQFDAAVKLGESLAKFREDGGLIVVSGMSVHNLREFRPDETKPLPYSDEFHRRLSLALPDEAEKRKKKLYDLISPPNLGVFRKAHPTPEHFLPLMVGIGAAGSDSAETLYMKSTGSLGWGIFKFGSDLQTHQEL